MFHLAIPWSEFVVILQDYPDMLTALVGTIVFLLVAIALRLAVGSAPTFAQFGPGFLTGTTWDVVNGVYGALPFVVGTLASSLLALLIAI